MFGITFVCTTCVIHEEEFLYWHDSQFIYLLYENKENKLFR